MKSFSLGMFFIFFSWIVLLSNLKAQSGNWISHPFPSSYNSQPLTRCGETIALCSNPAKYFCSIFNSITGKWLDVTIPHSLLITDHLAAGNVAFFFTDSTLYAYSALVSHVDSVHYSGTRLASGPDEYRGYQCGNSLALFVTDQSFYVFDATDGQWHSTPITLPDNYSGVAVSWVKDDFAAVALYRTGESAPKVVVYSSYHQAFNQIEYGPLPNTMMGHGFANLALNTGTTKTFIGYSAMKNQFTDVTVPVTGGGSNQSGPHFENGSVYAFYYDEVIIPGTLWRTHFYCYSTLLGVWQSSTLEYDPATGGYGGLHVGGEYASLLRTQINSYDPFVWSAYTNTFSQFTPALQGGTPAGFILGKNTFVCFSNDKAWGYDAKKDSAVTTTIQGTYSSNVREGKDFATFATWNWGDDSMTVYFFNGNTMQWSNTKTWLAQSSSTTGSDVFSLLNTLSSDYTQGEVVAYSALVDTISKQQFNSPVTYISIVKGNGVLAYCYNATQSFLYEAQNSFFQPFNFSTYSTAVSDSIMLSYNNSTSTAYGYSARTQAIASYTAMFSISLCTVGTSIGIIAGSANYTKCIAYNSYHNTWVPLLPEARTYGIAVAGNTALAFHDDTAYAFYPQPVATSANEHTASSLPATFSLEQNYPNPFNPFTTISFSLSELSFVSIKIYDLLGREIATVENSILPSGTHKKTWNASSYPSGIYFYRMKAYAINGNGNFVSTKKLVLLK